MRKVASLRNAGHEISPVEITGRKIATTFWGMAWCRNLESYSDFSNRLPRGRTYVRNGSVVDLQIESGRVRSLVSGSDIYEVDVEIKRLQGRLWNEIKRQCAGGIGSLVELLRGSLSKGVMEVVSRKGKGLFPAPAQIELSCSCPDWAIMCKHVAATLYGVGARLDHEPALLFRLRGVDPAEMVETAVARPTDSSRPGRGRRLASDDLTSIFGVDIAAARTPAARESTSSGRRHHAGKPSTGSRPAKIVQLPEASLGHLLDRAMKFAMESSILRELVSEIKVARGRLSFWRGPGDRMARITPVGPRTLALESASGRSWIEYERGPLGALLATLEGDTDGTFHGMGSLARIRRGARPTPLAVLRDHLEIPLPILAQPRAWYASQQRPVLLLIDERSNRALVRFGSDGPGGAIHGSCLYASIAGEWSCHPLNAMAARTLTSAEAWLAERG